MLNLFSVINIFGFELNSDESKALFWLLVAQLLLIIVVIVLLSILFARARRKNKEQAAGQKVEPVEEAVVQDRATKDVARAVDVSD